MTRPVISGGGKGELGKTTAKPPVAGNLLICPGQDSNLGFEERDIATSGNILGPWNTATLQELSLSYGNCRVIVSSYIRKALDWRAIKLDNPGGLLNYLHFLPFLHP